MKFVALGARLSSPVRAPLGQRGLTLLELLVSMTLGVVILAAIASVYVAAKQAYRFQDTAGRMTEDGNYALDLMTKHIRMAGYAGCLGINKTVVSGPPATTTYAPASGLVSADPSGISGPNPLKTVLPTNADAGAQPLTPATFIRGFDATPTSMFPSGSEPAALPTNTVANALFISGGGATSLGVSTAMLLSSSAVSLGASDPYAWAGKGAGSFVLGHCDASVLVRGQVANVAGNFELSHPVTDGNANADLAGSAIFDTKAVISPLEWRFFYLNLRSGAKTPSLYSVTFDGFTRGSATEIVSNVEAMRIQYGENTATNPTSSNPTWQADVWRSSASDVTDWARVVAVRIGLMMVSSETDPNSGEVTPPVPTLLGNAYVIPTGASSSWIRKEFSTTIVLRNRAPAR